MASVAASQRQIQAALQKQVSALATGPSEACWRRTDRAALLVSALLMLPSAVSEASTALGDFQGCGEWAARHWLWTLQLQTAVAVAVAVVVAVVMQGARRASREQTAVRRWSWW